MPWLGHLRGRPSRSWDWWWKVWLPASGHGFKRWNDGPGVCLKWHGIAGCTPQLLFKNIKTHVTCWHMSQVADSQLQKVVLNVKFGTFQWLFLFRSSNHLAWVHSIRVVRQDIDLVLCLTLRRALRYLRQRPGFTSHEPRNFGISTRSQKFAIYLIYIYILPPKRKALVGEIQNFRYHHKMKVFNASDPETAIPPPIEAWKPPGVRLCHHDHWPRWSNAWDVTRTPGMDTKTGWMKVRGGFFRFSVPFSPMIIFSVQWKTTPKWKETTIMRYTPIFVTSHDCGRVRVLMKYFE